MDLQDQGVIDSGCSRHMTGNMSYLTDYEEIDGGYVAFGGNPKGGKITRKGYNQNWSMSYSISGMNAVIPAVQCLLMEFITDVRLLMLKLRNIHLWYYPSVTSPSDSEIHWLLHPDNPHTNKDLGIVDSGCSRSMTGNKEKLADFVRVKGGLSLLEVEMVKSLEKAPLGLPTSILRMFIMWKSFRTLICVLRVPSRHRFLYCFNLTDIRFRKRNSSVVGKASL
ncbi:hypothetical protein Tco_0695596 [Tanacetum coccineum]